MEAATFERLLAWLLSNTSFSSSRHVEAAEKLMMFLWTVGHGYVLGKTLLLSFRDYNHL